MVPVHLILFLLAISVEGILATSPCNQTFTGKEIVIPGEIPTNVMNCTFNFSINSNNDTLMLVFSSLGSLSSRDNITISAESKIITTVTSENDRVTVVSTSDFTVVTFLRGSGKTGTFQLDYKKECKQEVDPSSGFLSSPKYLPSTKKIIKCTYSVMSPEGQITLLGFTNFNFKSGSLNVNGTDVTAGQNRTLPDDLLIPSNTTIVLSLPYNENKTEEFRSILSLVNSDCSNKTFNVYDNFIYTSFAGAVCHRMIDGPNGTLVVTVKSWQTDLLDNLQFRDGFSQEYKPLISGSSVQDNIMLVSSGSKMSMHLAFVPTIKQRRVEISFTSQAYGGLVKVGGDITYDSAKSGGKDGVFQCTLDAGEKKVSLTNFSMSNDGTVEVYDGNIIKGNPVFTIKNTSLSIPVFIQTNQMTIVTKSVSSNYTFRATTGMAQDCDQFSQLALGSYAVKSLGPNDTYACNLVILPMSKADYGGTIQLSSLALCPGDKVTISEGITTFNAQKELVAFTYNSTYQFIPQLIFGADKGARIVTALSKCDKRQAVVVAASYDMKTLSSVCGKQPQSPGGTVRSPYYPLRYPLNLECQWTFENKNNSFLYMTVDKLNIAVGNSLKLTGDKTEFDFTADKTLGKDLIFSKSKDLILSLTSVSKDGTLVIPGEGFVINYEYLDCGGSKTANFSESFSGDKKECRWIVSLPNTTQVSVNANSSVYIIKAKLRVSENYVPGSLTVYDGTNMTVKTLNLTNLSSTKELTFLSRVDTIIIQYTNATSKNFTLAVTITGYLCANFCQNGICLHDEWRCNNINDCGDNTDELNCSIPPPPSPTPSPQPSPQPKPAPKEDKGEVPGFWLAIMLIIGLIIGILLPFIIPAIFRRMRKRNYNRMTDMDNITADDYTPMD